MKKNAVFIFAILACLGIIIFLKMRYFPSSPKTLADPELIKMWEEAQEAGGSFGEDFSALEKSFEENQGNADVNDPAIFEKFRADLVAKTNARNIEQLDLEIENIQNVFSPEYEVALSVQEKNEISLIFARADIQSRQTCELFKDRYIQKRLEWYPYIHKKEVEIKLVENNLNAELGMCRKAIFFETEKFIILDACSNDVRCEETEVLEKKLKEYFEKV